MSPLPPHKIAAFDQAAADFGRILDSLIAFHRGASAEQSAMTATGTLTEMIVTNSTPLNTAALLAIAVARLSEAK